MIRLETSGRLANQLHFFILGMYISEITNMSFYPIKIKGFVNTYSPIIKDNKNYNILKTSDFNPNDKEFYENIKKHNGGIIINNMIGKYYNILPFSDKINDYLKIENEESYEKPNKDDLVIHIRLGDYKQIGCVTDKKLYLDVINKEKFNKCFILTDSPNDSYLDDFKKLGCIIRCKTPIEDFVFIKNANKIVISKSTFSWTAAFISNAEKIYFPLSDNKWPYLINPGKDGADLFPHDKKEWIKI